MSDYPDSSFLASLQHIDGGQFLQDLDDEQKKLLSQIKHRGGGGTLTIKIKFRETARDQYQLDGDVDGKPPKVMREKTSFFLTRHMTLTRNNPKQESLNLVQIDDKKDNN